MTTPDYGTDFYAWTQAQAAVLRAKNWATLNREYLAAVASAAGSCRPGYPSRSVRRMP